MKLIITLIVVLLLFTVPAFSELTPADIDKIRLIVKEEVAVGSCGIRVPGAKIR